MTVQDQRGSVERRDVTPLDSRAMARRWHRPSLEAASPHSANTPDMTVPPEMKMSRPGGLACGC